MEMMKALVTIARAALDEPDGLVRDVVFAKYPPEQLAEMRDRSKLYMAVDERIAEENETDDRTRSERRRHLIRGGREVGVKLDPKKVKKLKRPSKTRGRHRSKPQEMDQYSATRFVHHSRVIDSPPWP